MDVSEILISFLRAVPVIRVGLACMITPWSPVWETWQTAPPMESRKRGLIQRSEVAPKCASDPEAMLACILFSNYWKMCIYMWTLLL